MKELAHEGVETKPGGPLVEIRHHRSQRMGPGVLDRLDHLGKEDVGGKVGIHQLPRDQLKIETIGAFIRQRPQEGRNERAKKPLEARRWSVLIHRSPDALDALLSQGPQAPAEHLPVQVVLATEVVVHGGDIAASLGSDVPHRCRTKTALGEQPLRDIEQSIAGLHASFRRLGNDLGIGIHSKDLLMSSVLGSNKSLKHAYDSVKSAACCASAAFSAS